MTKIVGLLINTTLPCIISSCIMASSLAAQATMDKFVPVTQKDLNNPDPADWLMLGGNMEHWNYSPLDQINRQNVGGLQLVWARQMPTTGGRAGTSPIVHDGIMYLISPNDALLAVDALTGSRIWEYHRELPQHGEAKGLIHHNYSGAKRGLALYGDKIFTVTSDNSVVALDAKTGKVAWEAVRGTDGYVANTSGPIIANGVLIAGGSCQNAPFGCYVTGHEITTGKELWRNEVIPHPDGPGDETWRGMPFQNRWCTGIWGQIVYDPVQNLVHYGSSGICPASDFERGVAGKNATLAGTDTRWAVRPDTGEIVWRRQILPQDNWDQECTFEMMLVDTPMHPNANAEGMLAANPNIAEKKVRALVGMPCKNPVFWSLDAETGNFFYARETFRGAQNLYKSIDPVSGLATMNQDVVYDRPGKKIFYCSSHSGGRDAHVAPAYDPTRNIMIQATGNICTNETAHDDRKPGPEDTYNVTGQQAQNPNVALMKDGQYPVGQITAVDVATGNTVWQYQQRAYNYSAVLATAGGLAGVYS
jgi:alcohol dehydrogenase (cytochrome c)